MVRKKEAALTPEEKWKQALVPEAEQPYPVPGNWRWVKVGILVDMYRGVSYKKDDVHTEKGKNDCLIMRGGNIAEGAIDIYADNVYVDKHLVQEVQLVKKHDIIIVSSTGSRKVIGRAGISYADYDDVAFGAFLMLARPNKKADKQFINFFFQSDLYRERIRRLASGVNINNIRLEYITDTPIPLPPFPEQHRIVSRIESLFAKLDEAKEKLQGVVDGFETRKAAILHKAFTGELTERWREENGASEKLWKKYRMEQLLLPMETKKPVGESFYYIDIDSIDNKRQVVRMPKRLAVNKAPSRASRALHAGDTIFSMVRPYLKNIAYIDESLSNCIASTGFFVCRPGKKLDSRFLFFFLCSSDAIDYLMRFMKGDNSPSIRTDDLLKMEIDCPPIIEQKEIARLLSGILAREAQALAAAESVLAQIDTMKKSILARAFRGELGTNDPDEESAAELLKSITD